MLIDFLTDPHVWASFITLSAMEVVLGIDNVVFISLMVARMAPEQRLTARRIGLSLALVFRVIMLGGIAYIIHLTTPIFSVAGYDFSWRDLILIAAGAVAILVMYFASEPVAAFIERHPTTKMLALSFLLLIGAALLADGMHFHIPRGYLY